MNLKEFLLDAVKNNVDERFPFGDGTLYGKKALEPIKDKLLEFPEFSGLTSIEILDTPVFEIDGEPKVIPTYKLGDVLKFEGKGYLLSLFFTPEIFNPENLNKPVKDGACITPLVYDPITFEPKKKIVIEFSPERAQDMEFLDQDAVLRQELHDLLDKILNNPEEYTVKGERHVMLRGFFDEVDKKKQNISFLSKVIDQEPKYKMVFYLKPINKNEGEIEMRLEKKFIPIELSDKFTELFDEKMRNLKLTEEEIDNFLEENKK